MIGPSVILPPEAGGGAWRGSEARRCWLLLLVSRWSRAQRVVRTDALVLPIPPLHGERSGPYTKGETESVAVRVAIDALPSRVAREDEVEVVIAVEVGQRQAATAARGDRHLRPQVRSPTRSRVPITAKGRLLVH